jgi:hypothetical protein
VLFKFNGLGVHVYKKEEKGLRKVKIPLQQRKFKKHGARSQMSEFISITKI